MLRRCRRIVHFLVHCTLHVGRDPQKVEPPALILLPSLPATLFCGLAGILTLRIPGRVPQTSRPTPQNDISSLFRQAAERGLSVILRGRTGKDGKPPAVASYLGGTSVQQSMERELLRMKGEEAFAGIFYDEGEVRRLALLSEEMKSFLVDEEAILEAQAWRIPTADLETINRGLELIRDMIWWLDRDILENVGKIRLLAGADRSADVAREALPKYRKLNFLLNGLDRLEVRGRDSAGIQISFVAEDAGSLARVMTGLRERGFGEELKRRMSPGDLADGSIALSPPAALSFTYKTAEIIGELGRNVRELRKKIAGDGIFHALAGLPVKFETALTHTRWASVGSITEENCHPIGNFTFSPVKAANGVTEKFYPAYGKGSWSMHVVLNGDIDNYAALREDLEREGVSIAPEVTTDTKIIPLRIEKYLFAGKEMTEAFRLAVNDFEGSHAIAMTSNAEPGRIFLALKGSGQAIYIGITPDRYLFSSELYGLVEETPFFVKMDGEKASDPEKPEARGQIAVLDQDSAGGAAGIRMLRYDGTPLPVGEDAVMRAEMTTRDIDRGAYPHYFLKEITESALSVRKTLRGKYRIERQEGVGKAVFNLGPDVVPEGIREALRGRRIRRIVLIGHGTAAVAGSAVADAMERCLSGSGIRIEARVASELSGFFPERELGDTLVIPITQSGTTADTNRAVAMAVEHGAKTIAIVNRRQSDITTRVDGVLYTSDGRDIEMAVASTKAFYSQIVAGHLLALDLASLLSTLSDERITEELRLLERAPEMMGMVLARKGQIRDAAERLVRGKRYWAVVGSGPNKAAADEIRIKLSELCYQTISSDVVENKKHIDLSAEPLILVCAAGSPEAVMGDIVKDVAIFKAHKSSVVVFADETEGRFDAVADAVIPIPPGPQPLPVILNTVAGHLFGYYAACSIDADALFLRAFKSRLDLLMVDHARKKLSVDESLADGRLRRLVNEFTDQLQRRKSRGAFVQNGVGTISDLLLLLKYAAGKLPIDDFRHDFPGESAASPIDLLDATLGHAVDELSRPIDAIRHQAKTVTVGTTRKEAPPSGLLFDLLTENAFTVKSLLGTNVLALRRLQKAVSAVNGYTLYAVNHLNADGKPGNDATIAILKRSGVSVGMPSRADKSNLLMGTKKGIVASGRVYVGQGKSDGAPVVILPVLGARERVEHLLLAHVAFNETLSVPERKGLLGERVEDIRNLIQEYNLAWDDRCLGQVPLAVLLGEPVEVIAGWIRRNLDLRAPMDTDSGSERRSGIGDR